MLLTQKMDFSHHTNRSSNMAVSFVFRNETVARMLSSFFGDYTFFMDTFCMAVRNVPNVKYRHEHCVPSLNKKRNT